MPCSSLARVRDEVDGTPEITEDEDNDDGSIEFSALKPTGAATSSTSPTRVDQEYQVDSESDQGAKCMLNRCVCG